MNATARRTMCSNLATILKGYTAPGESETLYQKLGLTSIEDSEPRTVSPPQITVGFAGLGDSGEEASPILIVRYYTRRTEAGTEDEKIAQALDRICPAVWSDPTCNGIAIGIDFYEEEVGEFVVSEQELINGAEIRVSYDVPSAYFHRGGGDL